MEKQFFKIHCRLLFSLFCLPGVNTVSLEYLEESAQFFLGEEHKQLKIVKKNNQWRSKSIKKKKTNARVKETLGKKHFEERPVHSVLRLGVTST